MVQGTEEITEGTARLLHGVDASRRAGWAKFYGEAEKVEDLSRENNILREDRVMFERGFAFLYGFAEHMLSLRGVIGTSPYLRECLDRFGDLVEGSDASAGRNEAARIVTLVGGGKVMSQQRVDHHLARAGVKGNKQGRARLLRQLLADGVITSEQADQYA